VLNSAAQAIGLGINRCNKGGFKGRDLSEFMHANITPSGLYFLISPTPSRWPGEYTHLGSIKGAGTSKPGLKGREHGFVMLCGLKGRDRMSFGHHKPGTGRIAGIQPAFSSYPFTQP
jgi:hypothetical protein